MASRRSITRWNYNEEILLAESWIEHSQDANIEKDQHEDIYWNLIVIDFNSRTTAPPRTKNMMTGKWTRMHGDCQRFNGIYKHLNRKGGESDVDLLENANTAYIDRYDNLQELFGPDPRECPAGKQRAKKKQKSVETTSVGGSTRGSTGGSQSESVSSLVSLDYC
nr:glutathione S-transferase T3-like [Tanacetum cinerariifolium]